MNAMELVERLLQEEPLAGTHLTGTQEAAWHVVRCLLDEEAIAETSVCETTVHLPPRGRVWVASFTSAEGGQTWRSTGQTNRREALLLAKKWEAEARAERTKGGSAAKKAIWRIRRSAGCTGLTQKEVGLLLKISERAIRQIEHRAIRKLFNHPSLREAWRQYLSGTLDEDQSNLTPPEIEALFHLARTAEEWPLLKKVTRMTQR